MRVWRIAHTIIFGYVDRHLGEHHRVATQLDRIVKCSGVHKGLVIMTICLETRKNDM